MVRIHSGVPLFYHLAVSLPSEAPSRLFAQPDFCPRIVHENLPGHLRGGWVNSTTILNSETKRRRSQRRLFRFLKGPEGEISPGAGLVTRGKSPEPPGAEGRH